MALHRADGQEQLFGDGGIRQTFADQREHLGLPRGDAKVDQVGRHEMLPSPSGHGGARGAQQASDAVDALRCRGWSAS